MENKLPIYSLAVVLYSDGAGEQTVSKYNLPDDVSQVIDIKVLSAEEVTIILNICENAANRQSERFLLTKDETIQRLRKPRPRRHESEILEE